MAGGGSGGKCSKIRHVVRVLQILRRWRARAAAAPPGCALLRVGDSGRLFPVPISHLNHPVLRQLLARSAEEYGFNQAGPITVPCDEPAFLDILRHVSSSHSTAAGCSGGVRGAWHCESLPSSEGSPTAPCGDPRVCF